MYRGQDSQNDMHTEHLDYIGEMWYLDSWEPLSRFPSWISAGEVTLFSQCHVDAGKLPLWPFHPLLIVALWSNCRSRYHHSTYCLTMFSSVLAFRAIDGTGFFLTSKRLLYRTLRSILLYLAAPNPSFYSLSSQNQLSETS